MGGVIHNYWLRFYASYHLCYLFDRLGVQHHALAKDNEFRPVFLDKFGCLGQVDTVRVIYRNGEIHYRPSVCYRIDGDVIS
ncbi:hypothetical protein ES703_75094 [subsurface metagenome]